MRSLFALALFALASGARAQPITAFSVPAGDSAERCAEHAALRVCRSEHDGEATLTVTEGARRLATWPAEYSVQAGDFAAFTTDLDRDGGRDLVVASLTSVSNGLGVAYWTVDVLPDGASAPAYSFEAEDFDARGRSFAHDRGRLIVWATDWISAPDPRGRRPEGMYFMGRPFTLASGGLAPARSLPIRARRLLNSFSRDEAGGPVGWLSDRRAESARTDLALAGCRQRREEISVGAVHARQDDYGGPYLAIVAGGTEFPYGPGASGEDTLTHLGDAASGRLFPVHYAPAGLAARLRGGSFALTTCTDGDWAKARVLWM